MLLSVLMVRGGTGFKAIVGRYLLIFSSLGLAYFLWHWSYFGQPLPNPLYRKGAGAPHWHSMLRAWSELGILGQPFALALLAGLVAPRTRRIALFAILPVSLFALSWLCVSDETNYAMRFRYPVLPLLLLGSIPVVQHLASATQRLWPSLGRMRTWAAWPTGLALAVALAWVQHRQNREPVFSRVGLRDAAGVLRDYGAGRFTLATTEAGLLPLYSDWRAVDAWGLNDRYVAGHGQIDATYLDRYRPEVIMVHAYTALPGSDRPQEPAGLGQSWTRMVATLTSYAEERGYELAACFGATPGNRHYYYVRTGFPESHDIASRLGRLDYYWHGISTRNACADQRVSGHAW
jgi:hypothetical protein